MKLKEKVAILLNEVDKTHKYSMSRIYQLYNEVFGLAETPQSCASCLIRKVKQLRTWLDNQPQVSVSPDITVTEIKKTRRKTNKN